MHIDYLNVDPFMGILNSISIQDWKIPEWTSVAYKLKTCRATWDPKFPRTEPDQTEIGPADQTETGQGSRNILKNIFDWVGDFYFGSVRVGVFVTGYETFFLRFQG